MKKIDMYAPVSFGGKPTVTVTPPPQLPFVAFPQNIFTGNEFNGSILGQGGNNSVSNGNWNQMR